MKMDQRISVRNRSGCTVGYSLPELHIRREFIPGEEKRVPFNELEALSFQPGGPRLIWDYLFIDNPEAIKALQLRTEPEYYLDTAKVKDLLLNGSLDLFMDCLDFAPSGVISLVKKLAYELPLNDNAKREALKKATGFDVTKALELKRQEEQVLAESDIQKETGVKQRRVAQSNPEAQTTTTSTRRANPSKYNNVKILSE